MNAAATFSFLLIMVGSIKAADQFVLMTRRTSLSIDDELEYRRIMIKSMKMSLAGIGLMAFTLVLLIRAFSTAVGAIGIAGPIAWVAECAVIAIVSFAQRYWIASSAVSSNLSGVLAGHGRCRKCGYQLSGTEIECSECQTHTGSHS